jgi:outer membrane cobalamin receptor
VRLAAFQRELRNQLVDLQDPAWATESTPVVLDRSRVRGFEAEYERWLTRHVSAGVWVRWQDSQNRDSGDLDVPYQPDFMAQARLDYLDEAGWRAGLVWQHVGRRFADINNLMRLGEYDLLNVAVARQLDLHTDLFLNVDNVFQQRYGFYNAYPGRDRRISAGMRYRF